MLKVYIAASMNAIRLVRQYALELASMNIECTSTWRHVDTGASLPQGPLERCVHLRDLAERDIKDIDRADIVVVIPAPASSTGGLWTELGYCLARRKPLIIINQSEQGNPFVYLPEIRHATDWSDALDILGRIRDNLRHSAERIQAAFIIAI